MLFDIYVNGIVASRVRHLIKRYLKRVGFVSVKVEHLRSNDVWSMRLVASGRTREPRTDRQSAEVKYLEQSLITVLSNTENGHMPHASRADPELLREMLARAEPSMVKVYYKIA